MSAKKIFNFLCPPVPLSTPTLLPKEKGFRALSKVSHVPSLYCPKFPMSKVSHVPSISCPKSLMSKISHVLNIYVQSL